MDLLCEHRDALDEVAQTLQEREIIDGDEIGRITEARAPERDRVTV
jgi:hypothetical protein